MLDDLVETAVVVLLTPSGYDLGTRTSARRRGDTVTYSVLLREPESTSSWRRWRRCVLRVAPGDRVTYRRRLHRRSRKLLGATLQLSKLAHPGRRRLRHRMIAPLSTATDRS